MSYFIDDDTSQIRALKDEVAKLQAQLLGFVPSSATLENVESGQSIFPGANPSARVGGIGSGTGGGGGGTFSFPITPPVIEVLNSSGTNPISLSAATAHSTRIEAIADITLSFANYPPDKTQIEWEVEVKNTDTSSILVNLPSEVQGLSSVSISPSDRVIFTFRTNDGGTIVDVMTQGVISGGEVFTWSANHSANSFDLINISNLKFNASGNADNTAAHIFGDTNNSMVFNVNTADSFFWTENGETIGQLKDSEFQVRTTTLDGPKIVLFNNDQTPNAGDKSGIIEFQGNDLVPDPYAYGSVVVNIDDPAVGAKQGGFEIRIMSDNSLAPIIDYSGVDSVFRFSSNVDVVRPNRNDGIDFGSVSQSWKNAYFSGYMDFKLSALPPDPATGTRRIFTDPATGELSVVTDAGTIVSLEAGAQGGEANTGSNLGIGTGIFESKVGSDLRFKSLIPGTGVSFSTSANDIEINTSGLTNPMTAPLDMNGNDIDNVDDIFFNATDTEISHGSGIMSIRVPSSGTIRLRRGTTSGFIYDGNGFKFGTGLNIGVFGATPQSKQTVTGSRGGNAALANLLTALANYGLITNSTSS